MSLVELQVVAGIVSLIALSLLVVAIKLLYPKASTDVDESLEAMINGFDFQLPDEVEMYRKFKEEHPNETDAMFNMLFRRAVADIPLIRKIQSESSGIQRLKKNDILKDGSYMSYKLAEEMINDEINDVRQEAESLKPGEGWPDKIFPEAVQFMNHMAEQHMMAQRKAAEEQMEAMTQAQGLAQNESRSEKDGSRNASTEENEAGLRKRK